MVPMGHGVQGGRGVAGVEAAVVAGLVGHMEDFQLDSVGTIEGLWSDTVSLVFGEDHLDGWEGCRGRGKEASVGTLATVWGEDGHGFRSWQWEWREERGPAEAKAAQSMGLSGRAVSGASSGAWDVLGREGKPLISVPTKGEGLSHFPMRAGRSLLRAPC